MAAVVRIKRRLDEDPLETVILNCKRRKINVVGSSEPEELSTILQLAGTSQEEENFETVLAKHRVPDAVELKEHFKKHKVSINDKLRLEIKETSKNNRYRVVNCFRKTLGEENPSQAGNSSSSEVTVFDIETDCNKNEVTVENKNTSKEKPEENSQYVYDFYYTSSDDFGGPDVGDIVSLHPVEDPLVFGSVKDNGLDEPNSDSDSEDSNAENYFTNDYPDEEDVKSITEDDMIAAVNNLEIDDLSSDSNEGSFIYSKEEEDFQLDVGNEDELRYGRLYAKFKAKNKNIDSDALTNDLYYGDIDEDEYYY